PRTPRARPARCPPERPRQPAPQPARQPATGLPVRAVKRARATAPYPAIHATTPSLPPRRPDPGRGPRACPRRAATLSRLPGPRPPPPPRPLHRPPPTLLGARNRPSTTHRIKRPMRPPTSLPTTPLIRCAPPFHGRPHIPTPLLLNTPHSPRGFRLRSGQS